MAMKYIQFNIKHPKQELNRFGLLVVDQMRYRTQSIKQVLKEFQFHLEDFTCIVGRGGQLPPVSSGAYLVNQIMLDYLYNMKDGFHASNLGAMISDALAKTVGIPAYIYDPVSVNELPQMARLTGIAELPRSVNGHALNTRAVARTCAEKKLGRRLDDCTIIVLHLGGGGSLYLYQNGKAVDMFSDDDGGFCPERSGKIQAMELVKFCFSGKYTFQEVANLVRGNGGFVSHWEPAMCRKLSEK